ncbi:hypothetical protein SAMN05720473_101484 [Fibrobacter sp. UWB15]|jgi:hypothetical protein|uniref:hypothetical protein n=1 Tax=unclassified Fibrobacter TaxID=2634177 RepID=UPI0009236ABC|nr:MULTISPECIES: hypothetical protein [unclassified Fibrobacter]PWJ67608.1 hypothetical protein BGW99_101484 [Fibrobacter sp. UWB6]SHF72578.1 hypothetical protein SAMN05720760_101449 [Fibrobacter sp. UWB8]SMG12981.1 hypothetical protein SAMN05720473_101484 [Fibrobacter sp. UWB15]
MKYLTRFLSVVSLAFLSVIAGCNSPFSEDDPVVVSVGESKLRQSAVYRLVPEWDYLSDREKLTFLEHWIDEETIYQEALAKGFWKDPALQEQIKRTERKLTVDYYLQTFADTMMLGDTEKLDYYHAHPEFFVRGRNLLTGSILYFKDWQMAEMYYKGHRKLTYETYAANSWMVKRIENFDTVAVSPDSCILPSFTDVEFGKLSQVKLCGGQLKAVVVLSRLDSADVLPYAEVAEDVAARAWVEHQKTVLSRLKKEWKKARPIFSQMNVFSEKEK